MRRTAHLPVALAFLAPCALTAVAQPRLPWASPAATVSQAIGTSRVTIAYHRPAVRGRSVCCSLVPRGLEETIAKWEATVPR
jgi:hypothetical protein